MLSNRLSQPTRLLASGECLCLLASHSLLTPPLATLLGPREMGDGDKEEAVPAIEDTSQRVVPRSESGQNTEPTAGLDELRVGLRHGTDTIEVADAQAEESQIQRQEEEEEGDR